jgi:hypothetical protein
MKSPSPHLDLDSLIRDEFKALPPSTTGRERVESAPFSTRMFPRSTREAFPNERVHSVERYESEESPAWWVAGVALALALAGLCMFVPEGVFK